MGRYKSYLTDVQNEGGLRSLLDNVQKKDAFFLMASLTFLVSWCIAEQKDTVYSICDTVFKDCEI